MTRHERLLYGIDLTRARGIEIGPLTTPIVSKQIAEVYYVDHATREELQAKYSQDPHVDVDQIVTVDAVWGANTLRQCFPDGRDFDYVLASHVMEHVPDMIGWMQEIAEVLRPGGRLLLAVPDKRFTFDYLRQTSRVSEVIDAYLRRNRRPMPAQIFDYNVNAVEVDTVAAWEGGLDPAHLRHFVDARFAFERSMDSIRDGTYVDAHCWVFTARSLAALLAMLVDLDLLPFRCVSIYEPERNTNEIDLILERLDGYPAGKEEARHSFQVHLERLEKIERNEEEQHLAGCILLLQEARNGLNAAEKEIAVLQRKVSDLQGEINSLVSSRSFRITQPLRDLKAFVSTRKK